MIRERLAGIARLGLVLGIVLAPGLALAQSTSARVEGVVKDDTGAAVPGVSVTATNTATNFSKTATTDGEGNYTLTPLPLGPYVIKAELSGFQTASSKATLQVNQVARLDFDLKLGSQSEVIEVTATAPIIEKSTSSLSTVIDSEQVENLPLNGRNFTQLITLAPGVNRGVPGGNASGESGNTETFRYSEVGGGAVSANGVREQGNAYYYDGIDNNERLVNSLVFFPSPDALQEFRTITANAPAEFGRAGGAITNLISKSGTNAYHGSAYWFTRPESTASTPEFATTKPDFNRDQFGGSIGGPIVKDKTFFFANYAGLRQTVPVEVGNTVTVPTALMRQGNFSELLNPAFSGVGAPVIIYDPQTGQPFPGNIIPQNRLDPVAVAYLNAFPQPDRTNSALRNYDVRRENEGAFDDFDARIDHRFSETDQLFLRGSLSDSSKFDPGRIPNYQAGFGSGTAEAKAYSFALGYNRVFSANVVNELRIGYVNYKYAFLPVGFGTNQNAELGIPGPGGVTVDNGISLIGGGNGTYIEYLGDFGQFRVKQKTYQISDSVTWLKGRHAMKFGGTLLIADLDSERTQYGKGFYFYPDTVSTPANPAPAGRTGYEVAEMLIGTTQFTATGIPGFVPFETRAKEISLFAQDDWRVNDKLTLNVGLRWDLFTPYYEKNDRLANFTPTFGADGNITGGSLSLAGQNGVPRATVDTDKNNFGPRAGFAYQMSDKMVVRGSYGIFYAAPDRGGIDSQLTENPPNTVSAFRFSGPGSNVRLSDPIPLPPTVDPNNPVLPDGSGVVYVPRDNKTSYYQQFSVGFQREIGWQSSASVFYVGNRGDNLTAVVTTAGFNGDIQGRLRNVSNVATSSYDSLQVSLRRNAADFSYLASYTWGHAINDSPGPYPGPGGALTPTITNDLGVDKGNADFDVRHRFTLAATYMLPFARENDILGGWSLNGILTLQSGNWFSVFAGNSQTRADLVTGQDPNDGPKSTAEWFNTDAFSNPTADRDRSGRNIVVGPGLKSLDMSLFKTFKIKGDAAIEIRVESFNLFNTAQYAIPNQFVGDPNFGRITQTRQNSERQFQFAARLTF